MKKIKVETMSGYFFMDFTNEEDEAIRAAAFMRAVPKGELCWVYIVDHDEKNGTNTYLKKFKNGKWEVP